MVTDSTTGRLSVLSDSAACVQGDLLGFRAYLQPVLSILTDPGAQTPFTIGIFGAWGTGKSSLLRMLDDTLALDYREQFVRVHFNPWVHRHEPNMLVPLLHTLHDTLETTMGAKFKESASRIGSVLLRVGADVLLRKLTASATCLRRIEKIEESYCRARGRVESGIRNLRSTLQEEMDAIGKRGAKVVLFLDDLDRCEPAELIDLLEAVKLFLDLRNVFVLLAIDKEVIDRSVAIRYEKFAFAKEREASIGAEYLEKMVQLPLQLMPLAPAQVQAYVKGLCRLANPPKVVLAHLDLLGEVCPPNPRKIKRLLNLVMVTVGMANSAGAKVDMGTLMRLVVLQVQHADLYVDVMRLPMALVALARLYEGRMRIDAPRDFDEFGDIRDSLLALAQRHYQPGSTLAPLFRASRFEELAAELPSYFTFLGR